MHFLAAVFSLVFAASSLFACATISVEESTGEMDNTVKITGMVKIYGHEPFSYLGIEDQDGTQYAVHPLSVADELSELQGRIIEFTVVFLDEQAPGMAGLMLRGGTVTPLSWKIVR